MFRGIFRMQHKLRDSQKEWFHFDAREKIDVQSIRAMHSTVIFKKKVIQQDKIRIN